MALLKIAGGLTEGSRWPQGDGLPYNPLFSIPSAPLLPLTYPALSLSPSQAGEQMAFLELCTAQWAEFHQCCGCLGDWLAQAKEKVGREAYGSTLEEVASFGAVLEVRR